MGSKAKVFRPVFQIVFAVAIVAASSALLIFLRQGLSAPAVALLYLIPVVISASLWGFLAAITASLLSFLTYNYLFLPPYYTFHVAQPQEFIILVVMLGVAIFISGLMAVIRSNLEKAEAREKEAVQLYQLSQDLIGKRDQASIAGVLAKRLSEYFQNCTIEVEGQGVSEAIRVGNPAGQAASTEKPPYLVPLTSPHGSQGLIRVWGLPERVSPEEKRLLGTFANQGALALDTAALTANETRARILEESDKLKTAILSSVSHELRTPLATIQTAATTLFNPGLTLDPASRSDLEALLLEETDRMVQLIGNLLNMSRIEAGALKLQRQWNSLAEIIDTCMKRLERLTSAHRIQVDVPDALPLISVDAVLMEQVIINLVGNSIKFAPLDTLVAISARVKGEQMLVTVHNQGPAIPEEYLGHIFEKFYPVSGRKNSQGVGLGLSICKGIIEAHSGKIWAVNDAQGVAFIFALPLTYDGLKPVLPTEVEET